MTIWSAIIRYWIGADVLKAYYIIFWIRLLIVQIDIIAFYEKEMVEIF